MYIKMTPEVKHNVLGNQLNLTVQARKFSKNPKGNKNIENNINFVKFTFFIAG